MPVLQPAELWQRSGRYGFDEQFRLQDRKGADLVLAMTHEENVTMHVSKVVRSYRDLPLILYHIQVKERDEPRPRAGVLRTREFIMKDSYTFDRDADGLQHGYDLHIQAYDRIFDRCRARVVPGRVRRRDDGRPRARTSTWRRVRRVRTRSRCRPRATPPTSRWPARRRSPSRACAGGSPRAASTRPARRRSRRCPGMLGRAAGRADQGVPRDRRRARPGPRPDARRPPPERRQAPQRARPGLPPGAGGRGEGGVRVGRRASSARSARACPWSPTRR